MTMLAEENMPGKILGKKIKRLGVYNILYDKYPIPYVCSYMDGMRWWQLRDLMMERGIY